MVAPLHVVGALIVDEGRVFAARRGAHRSAGGLWEFPGGKVEEGESAQAALVRELREELSIGVTIDGFAARATTPVDGRPIDLDCYWATLAGPPPSASTDHDEMRWLAPHELSALTWSPADVPIIDAVRTMLTDRWDEARNA